MDKVLFEVNQCLQSVCLAGIFIPQRLLQFKFLILLPQPFVLFVNGVEVDVSTPETANAVPGADDGALKWSEHRDCPHADQTDRTTVWMVGIYGTLDLRGESNDLGEQSPGEHNRVAVSSEESFCRAAVFGGHDTMGAAARPNALR